MVFAQKGIERQRLRRLRILKKDVVVDRLRGVGGGAGRCGRCLAWSGWLGHALAVLSRGRRRKRELP